jgi:hypothetical protein
VISAGFTLCGTGAVLYGGGRNDVGFTGGGLSALLWCAGSLGGNLFSLKFMVRIPSRLGRGGQTPGLNLAWVRVLGTYVLLGPHRLSLCLYFQGVRGFCTYVC